MNKQNVRQAWVVPKLEQIEMVNTQTRTPDCNQPPGPESKEMAGVETGRCGVGS